LAFDSDKFRVFRSNLPSALSGTGLTQFGQALKELEIELICAHSPQATGRVERATQTLHERLVQELRLRAISSREEANGYLPQFIGACNARFSVGARSPEDVHRPLAATQRMERILVRCERRVLSKNLTLSYNKMIYQIHTKRAAYTMRGAQVEVRENSSGEVIMEYQGQALSYSLYVEQEQRQAQVTPSKLIDQALSQPVRRGQRQSYHPPMTHPWKYFDHSEKSMEAMERRGDICLLRK
jgi:hypothetical protein